MVISWSQSAKGFGGVARSNDMNMGLGNLVMEQR